MVKKLVIAFLILCSVNFYKLGFLGESVKYLQLAAMSVMVAILIINAIYSVRKKTIIKNFSLPLMLMFTGVFISMFTAFFSFNQSFFVSLYAQRDIYFYLFYFTLHALMIDKKELQRLMIFFGLLYVLLYLMQFFAFPAKMLDVPMREERGTIRIYMEGLAYAMISYFLCLQIFYRTRKLMYLILALLFFVPVVLFGARSGILTILLGTIFQLLLSNQIRSRVMITGLVILSLIPAYFFFQGIFEGIIQASIKESAEGTDNVRIMAIQYYLLDFIPDKFSYLTGIGYPSEKSPLGQLTFMLSMRYGYYLSDIGIIANYVTYGVLFVIGIIIIIYRSLAIRIKDEMQYLKFFLFFEAFLMLPIAAGFAYAGPIVAFGCIFYLLDISAFEYRLEKRRQQSE